MIVFDKALAVKDLTPVLSFTKAGSIIKVGARPMLLTPQR